MNRILFISSGNEQTNPRISKEMSSLNGKHQIDFIGFDLKHWTDKGNGKLDLEVLIDPTRNKTIGWLTFSFLELIAKKLSPIFKRNLLISSLAHSKKSAYLMQAMNGIKNKPDFIVAHTLPALYPAYYFSKKFNCGFSFDIEDWHPGEIIEPRDPYEEHRRKLLMQRILPNAKFVSAASPFFVKRLRQLIPGGTIPAEYIANVFSKNQFEVRQHQNQSKKISMVWFSQNISQGRGLEIVLPAIAELRDHIHLTLIGRLNQQFYDDFLKTYKDTITIEEPMPSDDLNEYIGQFDIGLAIDMFDRDQNRDIAITNKLLVYFQAGLYILATKTKGHQWFLNQYEDHGVIVDPDPVKIKEVLDNLITRIDKIREMNVRRFENAKKHCWETEQVKFIKQLDAVLEANGN